MNTPKVALMWPDFNFYHIARFRALHEKLGDRVLGIEFIGGAGDDESAQWRYTARGNLPIVTLFPYSDMKDLSRKALGWATVKKLEEWGADIVFVNGYSTTELRIVVDWAYRNNKKCFTFLESKKDDFKRLFLIEWFKRSIIKKLSGAICGGRLQKDYLVELGMPERSIFFGYDVVDNDFFKENGRLARENAAFNRKKHCIPEKYFITCSRLVKKKSLPKLLDAYKIYREELKGRAPWSLVICGAGSQGTKLERKVKTEHIEEVIFAGPKKPKELAIYYGLASAFILASTTEQWGLAVNEAMASGLPVIVTKVAGAAYELVEEGINGYTFDPLDINRLSELMLDMTHLTDDKLAEMGRRSQEKIALYSPQYFAENIIKAMQTK